MAVGQRRKDRLARSATRPRVLVIDDDDAVCDLLRDLLGQEGYAVATTPHGAAALELLKHHQPAVIVLDLRMPIMDGWAFVELYRRDARPPAAIVLLSATKDIEESAKRLRADAFVRKPFDFSDLLRAIRSSVAAS